MQTNGALNSKISNTVFGRRAGSTPKIDCEGKKGSYVLKRHQKSNNKHNHHKKQSSSIAPS